jgi:mRNA interferase HigB
MKVHLIRRESVELFCALNVHSRNAFELWLTKIKYADWTNTMDIVSTFSTADFLGNGSNKIVFDIGGNKYRIIVKYVFGKKQMHLFICWIGSHAEYDKLCKHNHQYTINVF